MVAVVVAVVAVMMSVLVPKPKVLVSPARNAALLALLDPW
jgi:hypothetical protein